MHLTARQLNRCTLDRQLLMRRERIGVVDAVSRVAALQAQQAASPYIALWNRVADFEPAELDTAFAEHTVVKATLMRITLHAVAADDYPGFHAAMVQSLRASRLYDRRFKGLGVSVADVDALIPELRDFGSRPRTKAEIESLVQSRLGELPKPGAWWALRTFGPFLHATTGEVWSFGTRPSYRAAPVPATPLDRDEAIRYLMLRYLQAFGPASGHDAAQFSMLTRAVTRDALREMHRLGQVVRLTGPDDIELFDVPDAAPIEADTPAPPRLMAMWDSTLLAYSDRSRMIPAQYRTVIARNNGDVLPTLLVDGFVAGVWRVTDAGIEATAFHPLPDDVWLGLTAEALALKAFLSERDPAVYSRFAHWWKTLPSAEVRLLTG